ncbi:MAG: RidA family protein [Pseudomonadota bacterium]
MKKTEIIPKGMEGLVQGWHASPGIVSGGHLFVNGFNGCPVGGVPSPEPEAQMVTAFDKVGAVLAKAGLAWGDVVDMTTFHVGLATHLELFKSVRARYVRAPYPAWTAIECAGFAIPGVIVELKVVAALRDAA